MREIIFRGKRVDNGEWVEGQTIVVIHQDDNDLIFMPQHGEDVKADIMDGNDRALTSIYGNYYQILPETVEQFTGLTDKNGIKIFEGDILSIAQKGNGIGDYFYPPLKYPSNAIVKWDKCSWMWEIIAEQRYYLTFPDAWCHFECKIIGNIHDNPELLEVVE